MCRLFGPMPNTIVTINHMETRTVLKTKTSTKEAIGKPQDAGKSAKTKFSFFGEEMIEKEVKATGNTGRVYLPPEWVGKLVKIIRID